MFRWGRAAVVGASALAMWVVAAAPANAAYYVSSTSKITASTPSWNTGSPCSASKPCLKDTASFPSNKTSVSGYLVVTFYKNSKNANSGGTVLGSVTSASLSVPSGSTATYSQTVNYVCKSLAPSTTTYYYYATARFMNSSGSYSSDSYPASAVLARAGGCAS